jgi:diguanylate cyclase (GGDEF)-like protein/PAS domain S-box-containing protein
MRGYREIPARAIRSLLARWPRARNGAAIVTIIVLITTLFVSLTGLILAEKKRSIEKSVEILTSNFVSAVDQQVTASIDKTDLVILALEDEIESELAAQGRIDAKLVNAWMTRQVQRIPELEGLRVTDANGTVIVATGVSADVRANLSDRTFFRAHRDGPKSELIVSKPVYGRVTDGWLIVLSRRYENADGSFAGIITAPIRVDHFTKLLSVLDLGPGGIALIRDSDLGMVTRYPPIAGPAGIVGGRGASRELTELVKSGRPKGTFHSGATADGIERTGSFRILSRAPFVVIVGMASDYYLADWRGDVAKSAVLVGVFAAVLSLSGLLLWWMWRQQAREGALAKSVLGNTAEGIMVGDAAGRIISVNRAFTEITGYSAAEAVGHLLKLIKSDRHDRSFYAGIRDELQLRGRWQGQVWRRRKDGETFLAAETITSVSDERGQLQCYVAVFTDITELHAKDERIRHMAFHDALTGLGNRVLLRQCIEDALKRTREHSQPFAVLSIDLDRFKTVNDMLGHRAGDELLRQVADRLRRRVGNADTIARVGGDEFVVLHTAMSATDDAGSLAAEILALLGAPYHVHGTLVTVGASIGIALAPLDGTNIDELLGHSDLALYRAKTEERNRFRFFESEMGKAALERRRLELDLPDGFANNQFELFYQPCVNIVNGHIAACEALIRWRHPSRGLIGPAEFIPVTEEIGLISRLGEWVIHRACEEAVKWPREIKVAVNLSAAQFIGGNLPDVVLKALEASGLDPRRLELEITETLLIDDYEGSLATLHKLRDQGVRVALDDFGTGYSSLTYLRQFPFDRIKIDKAFVGEMTTRPDCAAIVSAVAGLGRSLSIDITAEGIETRDQLIMVRASGCTEAQGYLFGKPVSAADLARILEQHNPASVVVA